MYHTLCLTYKWTIDEVDKLEMPMIVCLLEQIGETPPSDLLDNAEVKAAQLKAERDKLSAIQSLGTVKGKVRRRNDVD